MLISPFLQSTVEQGSEQRPVAYQPAERLDSQRGPLGVIIITKGSQTARQRISSNKESELSYFAPSEGAGFSGRHVNSGFPSPFPPQVPGTTSCLWVFPEVSCKMLVVILGRMFVSPEIHM